jgi:hypothetical protein
MARFNATIAALARIRELLRQAFGAEPAVVALYWTGPQADSRRLADGSTEWRRVSEGEWGIGFDRRAKYSGAPLEVIDGVEFFINDYPQHVRIDGRTLDYVNGIFRVS